MMLTLSESEARDASELTLKQDAFRMHCLQVVSASRLPDAMIGAGFIRNMIWDALHHYTVASPLNDVDVVYFDKTDTSRDTEQEYEHRLAKHCPDVNWEVRNQARMHHYHNDAEYSDTGDGIKRWVELQTCVGVHLSGKQISWFAPYGLAENWKGEIRINPQFPRPTVYEERIKQKQWTERWPELTVIWP